MILATTNEIYDFNAVDTVNIDKLDRENWVLGCYSSPQKFVYDQVAVTRSHENRHKVYICIIYVRIYKDVSF